MPKSIILDRKFSTELIPKAPFNFNGTVYNPGHFPTPTEEFGGGKWRQTFNFGGKTLGLRIENKGTVSKPRVRLTIFSRTHLPRDYKQKLISEIEWRFELDRDLSEFTNQFKNDRILSPALKRWKGMRNKCGYSLYESLIIYIVLQNATVRRTVQMMKNLLENYGSKVKFDKKEFYTFWEPERLTQISERELRNLKVGYRAKFLKKISESFVRGEFNEYKLRELDNEALKEKLLQLYGIGPASVWYLLFEVFHRWDVFDYISPWEQKIYSKLLFNKDLVPAQKILGYAGRKWGKYKMLAAFYILTDLFWRRKHKKIDWLEKLLRL